MQLLMNPVQLEIVHHYHFYHVQIKFVHVHRQIIFGIYTQWFVVKYTFIESFCI
jgi:hypothetical protein